MYLAQIILFVSLAVRISNDHLPAKLVFQIISFLSLGGRCTAEVGLVADVGEIPAEISASAEVLRFQNPDCLYSVLFVLVLGF